LNDKNKRSTQPDRIPEKHCLSSWSPWSQEWKSNY